MFMFVLQVQGCVNPLLGVDALLKLTDNEGEDLGECVVPLSSMFRAHKLNVTETIEVPLSLDGKYIGSLTGDFLIKDNRDKLHAIDKV